MNTSAIQQLLRSTRYNITQAKADLATMTDVEATARRGDFDAMYHQGYQNGRIAEMESLATTLEMVLAVNA